MSNFAGPTGPRVRLSVRNFTSIAKGGRNAAQNILKNPLFGRVAPLVHLYCGFSLWRQMAPQQSGAKFGIAFFGQFRASLRKDGVANYASIYSFLLLFVRGPDVLSNALNVS